jgi:hypothetical protein
MQMDGIRGYSGWSWIFFVCVFLCSELIYLANFSQVQGIVTCLLGIVGYLLIVDFPDQAARSWHFLNQSETDFMVQRIQVDRQDAIPEAFNLRNYLKAALDLKIWGFAALFGLSTTTTYAIAYFLPIM